MSHEYKKKSDEVLLLALACGAGVEQAAEKAGVNRRTVQRRLQTPKFQRQLQAMRSDMVQRTTAMLTAAGN